MVHHAIFLAMNFWIIFLMYLFQGFPSIFLTDIVFSEDHLRLDFRLSRTNAIWIKLYTLPNYMFQFSMIRICLSYVHDIISILDHRYWQWLYFFEVRFLFKFFRLLWKYSFLNFCFVPSRSTTFPSSIPWFL